MTLNVRHIRETLSTLEVALHAVERTAKADALYDVFRLAVIKSFELTIELIAKLLRKSLRAYGGAPQSVDTLTFNETIRYAGQTGMLDVDAVARWLVYRANRNSTAHDYGEDFVTQTVTLLPAYLRDARALLDKIEHGGNDAPADA